MSGFGTRRRLSLKGRRAIAAAAGFALLAALGACAPVQKPPAETAAPEEFVWPLPPEPARVKFIRAVKSSDDVEPQQEKNSVVSSILGTKKSLDATLLKKPYGVYANDGGDRIYITDTGWGKLLVFDFKARKFAMWGEGGKGVLEAPIGVTGDSQGRIYVADAKEQRVVVFDRDGNFVTAMGRKGELERPVGVAVNEALGRVYVVDVKKHHIAVYDMDGNLVKTIGKRGGKKGEFSYPTNIAVGRDGKLYVADTMNFRIQVMNSDGKALKTIGSLGDSLGQFSRPKGVTVDSDGNIYVVDAAFNNFQIFNPKGQLLLFVGEIGPKPGQFWLPAGAYMDAQNRLYIADQYNARVQIFERLEVKDDAAKTASD